jgi:hypothetical protein
MLLGQPHCAHLRPPEAARLQARRIGERVDQCLGVAKCLGHLHRTVSPLRSELPLLGENVELRARTVRHRQLMAGTQRLQEDDRLVGAFARIGAASLEPRESREPAKSVSLSAAVAD